MTKSYHYVAAELDTECGTLAAEYYYDQMTSTLEVIRYSIGKERITGDSLPYATVKRLDDIALDEIRERLG